MSEALTGGTGVLWTAWLWSGLSVLALFLMASYISSAGDALMVVSLSVGLGLCLFGGFVDLWLERLGLAILTAVFFYVGFLKGDCLWWLRARAQAGFFVVLCLLILTFIADRSQNTVKTEYAIRSDGN